jgi:hypothetical protein
MENEIKIKIVEQGSAVVNDGWIEREADGIVLIKIDLGTKYCVFCGSSSGNNEPIGIWFSRPDTENSTKIELVEYSSNKWELFAITISKYTISICLKTL